MNGKFFILDKYFEAKNEIDSISLFPTLELTKNIERIFSIELDF